jgi:hypothetical protein
MISMPNIFTHLFLFQRFLDGGEKCKVVCVIQKDNGSQLRVFCCNIDANLFRKILETFNMEEHPPHIYIQEVAALYYDLSDIWWPLD